MCIYTTCATSFFLIFTAMLKIHKNYFQFSQLVKVSTTMLSHMFLFLSNTNQKLPPQHLYTTQCVEILIIIFSPSYSLKKKKNLECHQESHSCVLTLRIVIEYCGSILIPFHIGVHPTHHRAHLRTPMWERKYTLEIPNNFPDSWVLNNMLSRMIYKFYLSTCIPRKSQAIIYLPLKKKSYSLFYLFQHY